MKVIILQTKNNKSIIGFSESPTEFAKKWLSNKTQFTEVEETFNGAKFTQYDNHDCVIYGSQLHDGETCYISCSGNLSGFNDNH